MALPRLSLPSHGAALAAFAAVFILTGLASHDPWKSWDAIGIGIAHAMGRGEGLLVPHVAGLQWMHDPPLYHWLAAALGRLLQGLLEFHAGARLASGVFVAAAFYFLYVGGKRWTTPDRARITGGAAMLMVLGALGMMVHAHEALPELAQLAALSAALAVLPTALARPVPMGAAFGAALGLGFLAAGWIAPAALWVAAAVGHLVHAPSRRQGAGAFLAVSLAVAAALAAAWLLPLALRAPEAFDEWRVIALLAHAIRPSDVMTLIATVGWVAWPAWPLALWALWSLRREWREPRIFVPALAAILMLAGQLRWGPAQQENLLPALAPMALVGAHGLFTLRRGAAGAFDWFGVLALAFFTGLVWLGYTAMLTGFPPRIDYNFARAAPGFRAQFGLLAFSAALALACAWLYIVFHTNPSPMRSVARWAIGAAMLWATFSLLWMPWVDYQKSYRPVAAELKRRLPEGNGCVAARFLGVPQAAALDYHAGIRTRTFDALQPAACRYVLVQGSPQHERDAPSAGASSKLRWTKVADIGRPGDRSERFRLYRLNK